MRIQSASSRSLGVVFGLLAACSSEGAEPPESGAGDALPPGAGAEPAEPTLGAEPATTDPGSEPEEGPLDASGPGSEAPPGGLSLDAPSDSPGDAIPPVPDPEEPSGPLVWPNADSHTNSDPWLVDNHDEIDRLEPRVLVINFDPDEDATSARTFAERVSGALAEGSRYHGYWRPEAPAFVQYQVAHVVDLPGAATRSGNRFGFRELVHSREFGALIGFPGTSADAPPTVCELFEAGLVNEVWVAEPPDDSAKLYEFLASAQTYDASFAKRQGVFDRCAGNGCIPNGEVECSVSVRLGELNLSRGPGCATHAYGHGFEGRVRGEAIPYLTDNANRFFNFGLNAAYGTPFPDFYRCSYDTTPCIEYVTPERLRNGPGLPSFEIESFGQGCGNVHFAPHSRFHYDYEGASAGVTARASCEHYALGDGQDGSDATSLVSHDTYRSYNQNPAYRDCGGGWSIYMRQSFPGYENLAVAVDGTPMKNWWPFLFY